MSRIQALVKQIKLLEEELLVEIHKKEEEFFYIIHEKRVQFEKQIKQKHAGLKKRIPHYLYDASLMNVLTIPFIWLCILPALFLDICITIFQAVCFPIYGIPKVRRKDYIIYDRNYLSYLNFIERLNCVYCSYFNGLIAYVQEIGARTEQYWCPIKYARKLRIMHSRYKHFIDYGDGENYKENKDDVRRDFSDIT